jgi:hypothetical protein
MTLFAKNLKKENVHVTFGDREVPLSTLFAVTDSVVSGGHRASHA